MIISSFVLWMWRRFRVCMWSVLVLFDFVMIVVGVRNWMICVSSVFLVVFLVILI